MSDCHFWELTCKAGEAAAKAGDDIVSKWAEHITDGVNKTLVSLGTIWVNVRSNVGGAESVASFIQEHQRWLTIVIAIVSLIVAAIQMAWRQRMEPLQDVQGGLLRLIVVGAAFATITQMLLEIGDLYSPWIIEQAGEQDDGKFLTKILDMSMFQTGQLGMIMLIVGGLIALLSNIAQVFLMFVRSGLLTLLTGFSPLAAAASTTPWGKQWFNKYVAWTMAFVAFKPTASTVYAASLKLLSGDSYSFSDDIGKFLMGIIFLILAIVALPALVKFLVPVTANIGGGGGTGGFVGGMLATGAVNVANRSMFRGGSGGGGEGSSSSLPNQPPSTQAPTGASSTSGAAPQSGATPGGAAAGAGGGAGAGGAGGGAAGGGGAGAGGAGAGGGAAAAGPVGAGVAAGVTAVSAGVGAVRNAAEQSTGAPGTAPGAAPVAAPSASGPSGARQGGRSPSGGTGRGGVGQPSSGGGGSQSTGAREVHRR